MPTQVLRYVNAASVGGDGTTNGTSGASAAYASVNAALAAEFTARGTTLVSGDQYLTIQCEGTTADTVRVVHSSSWTTDATHYVEIVVAAASRHAGKWNTSAFRLSGTVAAAWVLITGIKNLRLKGLQVENTRTSGTGVVGIGLGTAGTSLDIRVEECIVRATSTGPSFTAGIDMSSGSSGSYKVGNCLIYDFSANSTGRGIRCDANGPSFYLYSNTIVNCYQGVTHSAAAGTNVLKDMLFRSNALTDVVDGANWTSMDYCATDAASFGTGAPSGTGNRTSQTFTFTNEAGDDFHLDAADAGAKGFGTDLSADATFPLTVDIDGTTRSGTWDIGADQSPVAGVTFYLKDAAASSSNHGSLQQDGTAPTTATTGTGWTVGSTAATNYSLMSYGTKRAAATFGATSLPSAGPNNTLGDCWRSESTISGTFAAGTWTLSVNVRAVDQGGTQDGRLQFRVWRDTDPTGATATEISSGILQTNEGVNIATGADTTLTGTMIPGAVTLDTEYLFINFAWDVTGAA